MSSLTALLESATALFIVTDPLGLVPIFMALTHGATPDERRAIFARATFVGFLLILLFTFAGTGILSLFGITLSDFKIAGGILLLVIALRIVGEAHYGEAGRGRPGVVPLAIPLLVGPGAITTTIVLIGTYGVWITFSAVVLSFALAFLIFRYASTFYRYLGKTGSDVIAKIMGMLLAAIAVKFIREGVQKVFGI
ncbi:MAG TPA: MarC family protein [Armatimonadota bacterium]|nr:MarC family protein [Armatimonadota bacterium]